MSTWHAHADHLAAYAAGTLVGPPADSLEAHLVTCATCRGRIADVAPAPAATWEAISLAIDAPVATPVERLLVRAGCPDHTARLLGATPSLRGAWLLSITAALGFAALGAQVLPGDRGFAFFLALAPLVPLAGVAVAYGRGGDPLHEFAVAAPVPTERLLLLRATAVLVVSCAIAAAAALVGVASLGWLAAAWLLPALALTATTLALGTAVPLRAAATAVGGVWLVATTSAVRATAEPLAVFGGTLQLLSLVLVVAATAVVAGRSHRFDLGGVR